MTYEPEEAGVHFWIDDDDSTRAHLDVREMLEDGGEPYAVIMECVQMLVVGQRLVVHAIMQPLPLRGQLERMGHFTELRHAGTDHWELEITGR